VRCQIPLKLAGVRKYGLRTVNILNPDMFEQLITCVEKDICIHMSIPIKQELKATLCVRAQARVKGGAQLFYFKSFP